MRSMILLIVLFLIECSNQPSKNRQKQEESGIRQPMFWWMLLANRPKDEDPNCGGDVIGTIFGLNSNQIKYEALQENIEADFYSDVYKSYLSAKKTTITVSLIESLAISSSSENCSNVGQVIYSYCNGFVNTVKSDISPFLLSQSVRYEVAINTRNFFTIGSNKSSCKLKYKIKVEATL